jgi:hypothetical protein
VTFIESKHVDVEAVRPVSENLIDPSINFDQRPMTELTVMH